MRDNHSDQSAGVWTFIGCLFLVSLAVLFVWWVQSERAPVGDERVQARRKALGDMTKSTEAALASYGRADTNKPVYYMPVNEAMARVAKVSDAGQVRSNLLERVAKAFPPPPEPPAREPDPPSEFE